jgi:hypothetical protein
MKLSNLTVQLEKEMFIEHLSGLGADMGQISESKRVYKSLETVSQTPLINIEKFV